MNFASKSLGALVVSSSSEVPGCSSGHVLEEDLSKIWLSQEGIPQWICLSLQELDNLKSVEIRTVGWYCWHSYSTNPKEVRLHVSRDGAKFRIWDTLSADRQRAGTQLFCIEPINSSLHPFIAFEIMSTFGGSQTYLNQIYLYADEISNSFILSADPSRDILEESDDDPVSEDSLSFGGSLIQPNKWSASRIDAADPTNQVLSMTNRPTVASNTFHNPPGCIPATHQIDLNTEEKSFDDQLDKALGLTDDISVSSLDSTSNFHEDLRDFPTPEQNSHSRLRSPLEAVFHIIPSYQDNRAAAADASSLNSIGLLAVSSAALHSASPLPTITLESLKEIVDKSLQTGSISAAVLKDSSMLSTNVIGGLELSDKMENRFKEFEKKFFMMLASLQQQGANSNTGLASAEQRCDYHKVSAYEDSENLRKDHASFPESQKVSSSIQQVQTDTEKVSVSVQADSEFELRSEENCKRAEPSHSLPLSDKLGEPSVKLKGINVTLPTSPHTIKLKSEYSGSFSFGRERELKNIQERMESGALDLADFIESSDKNYLDPLRRAFQFQNCSDTKKLGDFIETTDGKSQHHFSHKSTQSRAGTSLNPPQFNGTGRIEMPALHSQEANNSLHEHRYSSRASPSKYQMNTDSNLSNDSSGVYYERNKSEDTRKSRDFSDTSNIRSKHTLISPTVKQPKQHELPLPSSRLHAILSSVSEHGAFVPTIQKREEAKIRGQVIQESVRHSIKRQAMEALVQSNVQQMLQEQSDLNRKLSKGKLVSESKILKSFQVSKAEVQEDFSSLVKELHEVVMKKTIKEAQLKILQSKTYSSRIGNSE